MSFRSTALIAVSCAISWLLPVDADLFAQGVTTAAIRGTVHAADGADVEGTRVTVENTATGFVTHREVRHGRFLVHGLEVGGPYTLSLQRLGFHPQQREGVFLRLGEPLELHFVLQSAAVALAPVRVAVSPFPRVNDHGGTATTVSDSLLHRLPTLNRNLYDFVRLAPQVSTRIGFAPGGMSGGGVGFRFNNFLINGVPQRSVPGGQPPEFAGARSVPFEAVSEYQILLAPFDVRYGDFTGALVNAVTRSGTNQLHGSVFAYARNDVLARRGEDAVSIPYERLQYGFSLGGPIRRDRLHFLVASDLQHFTSPAPGPYVGQSEAAPEPVPVSPADLARLEEILRAYGLEAGSAGAVANRNPLQSFFARLDLALPEWNSRAVLWANASRSSNLSFSRARDVFPLSTHSATQETSVRNVSLQFHTGLRRASGGHNELLVAYRSAGAESRSDVEQPIVRVVVPSTTGGAVTIVTGTPQQAHAQGAGFRAINLRDDLTLPLGASHVATLGFEAEWFQAYRSGVLNAYGTWTFASLDSLALGVASSFVLARDFGSASVPLNGGHYAAYVGDQWRAGERISLTIGTRAEMLAIDGQAPYNPVVDAIFERRTDEMPRRRVHLSPRLGFTWDLSGTGRDQLRGGVGVFTGRPPLAWVHAALSSYGDGIGVLRCGRLPSDLGPPPAFAPDDPRAPPTACVNDVDLTTNRSGDVDLLHRQLRMAQTLRGVLAYDRRLPGGLLGTLEALVTRNVSDFVFTNLNLEGPQGVDRHGRVLYGTIGPTGVAVAERRSDYGHSVSELRNTARNNSYHLSARLERRFVEGMAASAHYTLSRVRDVQTPFRIYVAGIANWSLRAVSGRHDDMSPGISLNDVPHRFVLAGTQRAPWRRWTTEFSFYYVGESGSPFAYLAWGARPGLGDLNADGSNANDPIYVPRSAFDPGEIRFSGRSDEPNADHSPAAQDERVSRQQTAFEQFIERTPCLRRQRGQILERNSCREPWSHTTIASLRQSIPIAGRTLEAQLDVYNLLNLLRREWGLYRLAAPMILEHVGQISGPPEEAQPIFRFDPTAPQWTTLPAESSFQLQLALRYRF